jgi:hypothetical protein
MELGIGNGPYSIFSGTEKQVVLVRNGTPVKDSGGPHAAAHVVIQALPSMPLQPASGFDMLWSVRWPTWIEGAPLTSIGVELRLPKRIQAVVVSALENFDVGDVAGARLSGSPNIARPKKRAKIRTAESEIPLHYTHPDLRLLAARISVALRHAGVETVVSSSETPPAAGLILRSGVNGDNELSTHTSTLLQLGRLLASVTSRELDVREAVDSNGWLRYPVRRVTVKPRAEIKRLKRYVGNRGKRDLKRARAALERTKPGNAREGARIVLAKALRRQAHLWSRIADCYERQKKTTVKNPDAIEALKTCLESLRSEKTLLADAQDAARVSARLYRLSDLVAGVKKRLKRLQWGAG